MPFIDRKEQAELAEKAAKELAEAMLMEGMVDTEGLGLGGEGGGGGIEGVVVGTGVGGALDIGGGVSVDGSGSVGGTVASGLSGAAGGWGGGGGVPPSDPTKKRKKGKVMSDQMTVEEAAAKAALMFETDALAQVQSLTSYRILILIPIRGWMLLLLDM